MNLEITSDGLGKCDGHRGATDDTSSYLIKLTWSENTIVDLEVDMAYTYVQT